MVFPVITATYAAILGLIFAALSAWVITSRLQGGVLHGDGGEESMTKRMRIHGNFAEYVPLILLLIGLLEAAGSSRTVVSILLLVLVVARLLHPIGMMAPVNSLQQYACRGGGASATLGILVIASVLLLVRCISG